MTPPSVGAPEQDSRICVICGASLKYKRHDALCCSGPCRAERSRLLAILNGRESGRYAYVVARLEALEHRGAGATGGVLRRRTQW